MSAEQWAEGLVQKINDRDEKSRIENEAFVLRENLRRKEGPHLWTRLREALKSKAETLNQVAGRDVFVPDLTNWNKVIVGNREIVEFNRERLVLGCHFGTISQDFRIKVGQDGEVQFGPWESVERLAQRLIETNC